MLPAFLQVAVVSEKNKGQSAGQQLISKSLIAQGLQKQSDSTQLPERKMIAVNRNIDAVPLLPRATIKNPLFL